MSAPPDRLATGAWRPLVGLAALVAFGLAFWLVRRASYDPPVPDPSEVDTDTDATSWIPAEDAGLEPDR